tara:strand:+ start:233 stop:955 length:723 start_codon:yes stop_codon:yes gene_type:complete
MMKKLVTTFVLVSLTTLTHAQEYPNLQQDKPKYTDVNNHIFKPGTQFFYQCVFAQEPKDTIVVTLSVLSLKKRKKTEKKETEIGFTFSNAKNRLEQTGIVENETNLWIHPPRTGAFKMLELYPYPYIKHTTDSWEDMMIIGGHWIDSIDNKEKIRLDFHYENTENQAIETPLGKLACTITEGQSIGLLGTYSLTSYYHPSYGFVRLKYHIAQNTTVDFWLVDVNSSEPIKNPLDLILKGN